MLNEGREISPGVSSINCIGPGKLIDGSGVKETNGGSGQNGGSSVGDLADMVATSSLYTHGVVVYQTAGKICGEQHARNASARMCTCSHKVEAIKRV